VPRLDDDETYELLSELAEQNKFRWKDAALEELRRLGGPSHLAIQDAIRDHLRRHGRVGAVPQYEPYEGHLGYEFRLTVAECKLFVKLIIERHVWYLYVVSCHSGWRE